MAFDCTSRNKKSDYDVIKSDKSPPCSLWLASHGSPWVDSDSGQRDGFSKVATSVFCTLRTRQSELVPWWRGRHRPRRHLGLEQTLHNYKGPVLYLIAPTDVLLMYLHLCTYCTFLYIMYTFYILVHILVHILYIFLTNSVIGRWRNSSIEYNFNCLMR